MKPSLSAYLELTKPRLTLMVLVTVGVGFLLGAASQRFGVAERLGLLVLTIVGVALAAGGANAMNQYLERDADGLMKRTQGRPLPQKRLLPWSALLFGLGISIGGVALLALAVSVFCAWLALLAWLSYVLVYTPLKKKTILNTLVGAIPGAVPPVLGYAAAGGVIGVEASLLFAILFLWQLPHFLAIAWMYREDYARAGFAMLPVLDPTGERTSRHILIFTASLVAVSLMPSLLGLNGLVYFIGALVLGLVFAAFGMGMMIDRSKMSARRLFIASDMYLPSLLGLMLAGKL